MVPDLYAYICKLHHRDIAVSELCLTASATHKTNSSMNKMRYFSCQDKLTTLRANESIIIFTKTSSLNLARARLPHKILIYIHMYKNKSYIHISMRRTQRTSVSIIHLGFFRIFRANLNILPHLGVDNLKGLPCAAVVNNRAFPRQIILMSTLQCLTKKKRK